MQLMKATYTDQETKQTRKTKNWYIQFRDHESICRRLPAFKSRSQSLELGRNVELLVECRISGERPTGDLARWLEALPSKLSDRLAAWGILDAHRAGAAKPLTEHSEDYHKGMLAKGDCKRHANQEKNKIAKILKDCGFRIWSDISASRFDEYLACLRKEHNASIRTSNSYLIAFKAFCNWCVRDGRALSSPVQHLQRLNAKTDVRLKRRALSPNELRKLLKAAQEGEPILDMPGPERALLYRVAAETGLRWSELRSLTRFSFSLGGKLPAVKVLAGYSKNRREDTLPLKPETAGALKTFFELNPALPETRAFPHMPLARAGGKLIKTDLVAAKVAEKDASDAEVDFHALRHTFISGLAQGGVHPKTAQDLARHSTIALTMDNYTHTVLQNRSDALKALPDLDVPVAEESARATGTDGENTLHRILPKQAEFGPTNHDQTRRPKRGKMGGAEERKSPANTGNNLHPQGSSQLVGAAGLEPATSRPPVWRASQAALRPDFSSVLLDYSGRAPLRQCSGKLNAVATMHG